MSGAPSVLRGTAVNLLSRLTGVALVLAITAVAARQGPAAQGSFALFTSIEAAWLALCSGFGVALARRVSHHGEQPAGWASAMLLVCAGLGLVAGLALWAWSSRAPAAYGALWLLALAAPVLLWAPNLAGWWLGEGRMGPMAMVSLAPPALTLLGLAVLVLAGAWPAPAGSAAGAASVATAAAAGVLPLLVLWVAAKVVVGVGVAAVMARARRLARPRFGELRASLGFVATIGLTNVIGLLNYRVGLFVLERQLGLAAVGVYSIAVVIAELLWFVSGSLTQAAYGRIGTPDGPRAAALTLRVLQLSAVALVAVAPLLVALAWWLVPWVLGPSYQASLPLLLLLLPGVLLFGAASALSAYFTNHAGQPRVPAQVAALSLVLNGGLAWVSVPAWGMAGAAMAASVAYAASVGVLAWRFARHAGLPWSAIWRPGPALAGDLAQLGQSWRSAVRRWRP